MTVTKKRNEIDMLNGSLVDKLILFAIPIGASSILQQLFNSADTAVVGRFATSQALAAVGTNGELISIFITLSAGLSVGVNVIIANLIGKGQTDRINQAVHTSISFGLLCGILMMIVGQLIAEPLLSVIHTPIDIMDLALQYFKIYLLGAPFMMLYNFGSAILRAKGDSKTPFNALLFSGIINVLLNLFFVIGLKLSVSGVALATDISTAISAFLILYYLSKEDEPYRFSIRKLSWNLANIKKIFAIGGPAGIQEAVFCISNVFIQAAINSFGSDAVAGAAAALNFEYFAYYMVTAFAQTATTFISQNHAAGKESRCSRIYFHTIWLSILSCAIVSIPCTIFGTTVLRLYSTKPEVIAYGMIRIMSVLVVEPIAVFFEVPAAALRGRGMSLIPTIETILGTVIFRIIWLSTVFNHFQSFRSIFLVYPVSWMVTGLMLQITYFMSLKKPMEEIA